MSKKDSYVDMEMLDRRLRAIERRVAGFTGPFGVIVTCCAQMEIVAKKIDLLAEAVGAEFIEKTTVPARYEIGKKG